MNPRHASALVLIAVGTLASLMGLMGATIGLFSMAENAAAARMDAKFAIFGGLLLVSGLLFLFFGVRMYRRSDRRLEGVRDARGLIQGFPFLSPIIAFLFLLVTGLVVWFAIEYGIDFTKPEELKAYATWGIVTLLFLASASRAIFRRLRGGSRQADGPLSGDDSA
jgi:hypothetical protein